MISPEQIRSARALLDWSTAFLAEQTGLTINGLNKIERGHVNPQRETVERIQKILEAHDIEFLPSFGLRKRDRTITMLEGLEANRRLALDVYDHLKDTGGELLIIYGDEEIADLNLGAEFMEEQFKRRKAANITHRILSGMNEDSRYEPLLATTRKLPLIPFSKYPLFIYGSRFALLSTEYAPKVFIIDNERIANGARHMFNFIWDLTKTKHYLRAPHHRTESRKISTDSFAILNPEQIRAARAFLDWSTADLAKQTGLTVNGLNKIERGHVIPQKETLITIRKIYEAAGLDFLPFSGIRKKDQLLQVWDDEGACARLLDDIYHELRDTGGEVCIFGVAENIFTAIVGKDKIQAHLARLMRHGIQERLIVKERDINIEGPLETYHEIPAKYFQPEPFCLYGSKLAFVSLGPPLKIIVIDDIRMVESVQVLFDFVWDNTRPLSLKKR